MNDLFTGIAVACGYAGLFLVFWRPKLWAGWTLLMAGNTISAAAVAKYTGHLYWALPNLAFAGFTAWWWWRVTKSVRASGRPPEPPQSPPAQGPGSGEGSGK